MEPIKHTPRDNAAGRPMRPTQPRPLMNDFAPRPHAQPSTAPVFRSQLLTSAAVPLKSTTQPVPQPRQAFGPTPAHAAQPRPHQPIAYPKPSTDDQLTTHETTKQPKVKAHQSRNHAGVIGFTLFVVLTALVLLPILPGKILDNFPGSSQSASSGDQAQSCLTELSSITTVQSYDSKVGFPIVYKYAASTTQHATCAGKQQTSVVGRTSQFNPLGAAIDIAATLIIALAVTKIWHKIFAHKD